jgi:hypothetical protein
MSAKGAVPRTNAYKAGARTGATAGYISHYKSRVTLKQDSYMDAAFSDVYSRLEIQLQNTRIESRLGDERSNDIISAMYRASTMNSNSTMISTSTVKKHTHNKHMRRKVALPLTFKSSFAVPNPAVQIFEAIVCK